MTKLCNEGDLRPVRVLVGVGAAVALLAAPGSWWTARATAGTPSAAPSQSPSSSVSTAAVPSPSSSVATAPVLLPVGSQAPDFWGVSYDGKGVTLSKLKGQQVVLYFYPKDDTPGCAKEACEIRDSWSKLQKAGVAVFGVSEQGGASHEAFAKKYKLPFPLLVDEDGDIAARFHVPVVAGKARRITYLIDKDGKIKYVWPNVNPVGHAADILSHVDAP